MRASANNAFGSVAPTGSRTVNLRFAGQYADAESGLFYNHNRYYDPKTGRYISSDPIGLNGGLNTFAYTGANPVMYVDPQGLWYTGNEHGPSPSFEESMEAIEALGGAIIDFFTPMSCFTNPAILECLAAIPFPACKLLKGGKYLDDLARVGEKTLPKSLPNEIVEGVLGKSVHKNSLDYVGETHVYEIIGSDGKRFKIGESAQGLRKGDGQSIRAEQQARKLRRETGEDFRTRIIETFPEKRSARDFEREIIESIRAKEGKQALPGNKTNR